MRVCGTGWGTVDELRLTVAGDPAGRMGFGPGLINGSVALREPLADVVSTGGLGLASSLPLSDLTTRVACEAGARLLLIPNRPRFMMLAGVTGVMRVSSCEGTVELATGAGKGGEEFVPGGAGGGIDRSTGEGESFSAIVLFRLPLTERRRGVDVADLAFRAAFFAAVDAGVGRFLLV